MSTLGAYYQVYNNKVATNFVLQNFRRCYPESPILLISDGGLDFSDLAQSYNAKFVKLHNIFVGEDGDSYYDSKRMIEGWRRHKMAVEHAKTDYIMILEDDVLVQRRVEFGDFDIKGPVVNDMPPEGIREIIKHGGQVGLGKFGACGGSVYKSSSFMNVFEKAIKYTEEFHDKKYYRLPKDHGNNDRSICAIDCNIVFHFNMCGYSYENAEWLSEFYRHSNWKDYPIVHQYKEYY